MINLLLSLKLNNGGSAHSFRGFMSISLLLQILLCANLIPKCAYLHTYPAPTCTARRRKCVPDGKVSGSGRCQGMAPRFCGLICRALNPCCVFGLNDVINLAYLNLILVLSL